MEGSPEVFAIHGRVSFRSCATGSAIVASAKAASDPVVPSHLFSCSTCSTLAALCGHEGHGDWTPVELFRRGTASLAPAIQRLILAFIRGTPIEN
jgi:hypothetical protein